MKRISLRLASAMFVAATLSSCSIGYNHQWKKAAAETAAHPPKDLSGAWEGTWRSEATGHTGTLKAIVTPPTASWERDCRFKYLATWKKVLSAVMVADHKAQWTGDKCVLSGEKDLGALGGVYHFTGTATAKEFHANYRSKMDHGVFEMKRPQ